MNSPHTLRKRPSRCRKYPLVENSRSLNIIIHIMLIIPVKRFTGIIYEITKKYSETAGSYFCGHVPIKYGCDAHMF